MTRFLFPAILLLLFTSHGAMAQNEEDALRFSQYLPGGTARSWALGGAMGAAGADPASASTNPAGFGLYNVSEVSFSPQFEVNGARSTYHGTSANDNDNRFSFNNLSLVLSSPYEHGGDWRSGTFGVSFDRLASFHWEEHATGAAKGTILQKFVNEANGTAPGSLKDAFPFTSNLAYMAYGIDPLDTVANTYSSAIPFSSTTDQDHRISSSGRLNTTSFFYAANYLDKLYVGATLGLVGLRYERHTAHAEKVEDPGNDLKDLSYTENLVTTGNGVDLKLGFLARAGKRMRLGLAFHSPKWLLLGDSYNYVMSTGFRTPVSNGKTSYSQYSPDGTFNYRLRTPWSVLASASYIAGTHGLVSIDYGYTDFRQARLKTSADLLDDYDFSSENQAIQASFRGTHSLRVGTEWRSGAWYFRGGWGIWPDAYADQDRRQGTAYMRFTGGIGFRSEHISVDLAGVYGKRDTNYFQYDPGLADITQEQLTDTRGLITVTFRP